jgi:hypothetical protein
MKTKYELGEEVYLKAKVMRIGLSRDEVDNVFYDLAVNTSSGETFSLNNIKDEDIFRPSAWNAFGMDKEGADYRACQSFGPMYK